MAVESTIATLEAKRTELNEKIKAIDASYGPIKSEMVELEKGLATFSEIKAIAGLVAEYEVLEKEILSEKELPNRMLMGYLKRFQQLVNLESMKTFSSFHKAKKVTDMIKERFSRQMKPKLEAILKAKLKIIEWPKSIELVRGLTEELINDILDYFSLFIQFQVLIPRFNCSSPPCDIFTE